MASSRSAAPGPMACKSTSSSASSLSLPFGRVHLGLRKSSSTTTMASSSISPSITKLIETAEDDGTEAKPIELDPALHYQGPFSTYYALDPTCSIGEAASVLSASTASSLHTSTSQGMVVRTEDKIIREWAPTARSPAGRLYHPSPESQETFDGQKNSEMQSKTLFRRFRKSAAPETAKEGTKKPTQPRLISRGGGRGARPV